MGTRLTALLSLALCLGACAEDVIERPRPAFVHLDVVYSGEEPEPNVADSLETGIAWWEERADVWFDLSYTPVDLPEEPFDNFRPWEYHGDGIPVFVAPSVMALPDDRGNREVSSEGGVAWYYGKCTWTMALGRDAAPWLGAHEMGHLLGLPHVEGEGNIMDTSHDLQTPPGELTAYQRDVVNSQLKYLERCGVAR